MTCHCLSRSRGAFKSTLPPLSEPPHHRNAPINRPSRNELACGFVSVAQQGQGCDGFGHDCSSVKASPAWPEAFPAMSE